MALGYLDPRGCSTLHNAEVSSFFATSALMLEAWQGMPKVQVCPCRIL